MSDNIEDHDRAARMIELVDFLLRRYAEEESWVREGTVRGMAAQRITRDCEAKRRIVRTMGYVRQRNHADEVLYSLALPYADHPDYREEWRP